ncbi:MAG: glucosaminidase domain-containing protein [Pseudomonadota bacterium]|nr:glucosaminidase domain-containing protein [Pseudomonadota bacterium]
MITIGSQPGTELKFLRTFAAVVLLFGWVFHDMPQASPHEAQVDGLSQRGAGARIRARMDRAFALAQTSPTAASALVDELLTDLHERRTQAEDPLDSDTREALAREVLGLRTALALAAAPLPKGFRGEFLASVIDGAAWSDWSRGVPASITVAQAILESNWGKSAPSFNLFGLKGEGPAGSNKRRVVEYKNGRRRIRTAAFRAYHDVGEALDDHARILANSRHYARARAVAEEPARYALALQGTYATDPRYAGKLVDMIERYALDRFDWNARSPWL